MEGIRDDLLVPIEAGDVDRMLEFWRWLIPASCRPLVATALGDLFLDHPDGRVSWLEMGTGELRGVADDAVVFRRATRDPENRALWFGESFVDRLRGAGLVLGPSECYSYRLLPILGGEYAPSNFQVHDLVTHFRVWGPIHERLRDLPDGSSVILRVADDSKGGLPRDPRKSDRPGG